MLYSYRFEVVHCRHLAVLFTFAVAVLSDLAVLFTLAVVVLYLSL